MGSESLYLKIKHLMVNMIKIGLAAFILSIFLCPTNLCAGEPVFGDRVDPGLIEYDDITEASGIAASRKNANVLWIHNDSGGKNSIFAMNMHGKHPGIYYIDGVTARDWEDIAAAPGPIAGEHYLYPGDIGDNHLDHSYLYIHRVIEPVVNPTQEPNATTLTGVETITFQFPDGNHDAETLMVDPVSKDGYIISKREGNARVYRFPYPQSNTGIVVPEYVTSLEINHVVGGDISFSGQEVILKTYFPVFYYDCKPEQRLREVFANKPVILPYILEPQGEAICWEAHANGYFTTSEEFLNIPAHLYFYPRLDTTTAIFDDNETFTSVHLQQNSPNPFNSTTIISFQIPTICFVTIDIYNQLGRKIRTLINEQMPAGPHSAAWDGRDQSGSLVPGGVYYYKIRTDYFNQVKTMTLMR